MFKIYVPVELRFFYADDLGNYYDAPSGNVVEQPYSEKEALRLVREERTRRLYECDWTQLLDAPLTDAEKAAWREYRQQLRDLMEIFQWNVTRWPRKP